MNTEIESKLKKIIEETDTNFAPYYDVLPILINERGYKSGIETGVFCFGHSKSILDKTQIDLLIGVDKYEMYEQSYMLNINSQEEWNTLYDMVMQRGANSSRYSLVRQHSKDALEYVKEICGGEVDFVFLDSLHTYENLKWELKNYGKLVRKGGVICCHDYRHGAFPLLTNAIDEYAELHCTKVNEEALHFVWMEKNWD